MNIKWTNEMLAEEALKYKTRKEFQINNISAYQTARNRNLLDDICSHMPIYTRKGNTNPRFKWTDEMLFNEALKYKNKEEFKKNSRGAYEACKRRDLMDKVTIHMENPYTYWTLEELQIEALKYKTRGEFEKKNISAYASATKKHLIDDICSHMPKRVDRNGKNNSNFKWSKKDLEKEALKYKTRGEFQKQSVGAYSAAINRNLLDEICSHMNIVSKNSLNEIYLFNEIKNKFPLTTKIKDRKVNISDKPWIKGFEIDIYIPNLKKGIEYDGTYHHSVEGLRRGRIKWPIEDILNYHFIKDTYFKSKGIDIFHIKEENWLEDKEKCLNECFIFLKGNQDV